MKKLTLLLMIVLLSLSLVGCSALTGGKSDKIVIGGKNFTEQDILVYIMKDIIEAKTNLKVEVKPYLGGTNVVSQALERGDLDIYAEYTGTGLINILGEKLITDPDAAYAKVSQIYREKKKLVWLKPFGFNNTYTLSMRADQAEKLGIETFSDLVGKAPKLILGATHEFLERQDGYKGLQEAYGIKFGSTSGMDPGLTYGACRDYKVDVIDAFSTDGRIPAFNLKVLKDDKRFFPPYYAAPVIREDTLNKHPEIADALNLLAGKLDEKEMSSLNAKVDLEKKDAKIVAREWLKSKGLI
ncbi:glycine betaine ABC transporter substrate-binding protein [Dendrosporobacter sp. 1207_IL3150]|uniref:glycine betaine ABC transporter substrate-binding protein n=1 Tax=Dendrosporobacter sp. 1207_IL3150 TaxID=3084054 RepID=UPI002FDB6D17